MKKWIGCLVFLFLMSSCAEEVAFNSPSVQGLQNNQFWRALQSKATIDDKGTITIQAVTTNETLTLYITPPITGAKKT